MTFYYAAIFTSSMRFRYRHEVRGDGLGRSLHSFLDPPHHRFRKAADKMIEQKLPRHVRFEHVGKALEHRMQMTLEIRHKQLARIGQQYARQVVFFVADMPERMRELAFEVAVLPHPRARIVFKYMEKKLLAQRVEQEVLRFKM